MLDQKRPPCFEVSAEWFLVALGESRLTLLLFVWLFGVCRFVVLFIGSAVATRRRDWLFVCMGLSGGLRRRGCPRRQLSLPGAGLGFLSLVAIVLMTVVMFRKLGSRVVVVAGLSFLPLHIFFFTFFLVHVCIGVCMGT